MKGTFTFAALVLAAVLAGCASTQDSSVSAGAVGDNGCCKSSCTKGEAAAPGAVSEGSGCSKSKSSRTAGEAAAPGAVSDSSGCSKSKSSCTKSEEVAPGAVSESGSCSKVCPVTGKAVSPGAVSDAPRTSCCSKGK